MTVRYEFLFSVYSAPPFITEILMVLLVIVILGFPCTSYLSRYVPKNIDSPSETSPEVGVTETVPESNELAADESESDTGIPEPDPFLIESGSEDSGSDDSSPDFCGSDNCFPDDSGPDDYDPGGSGPNDSGPAEPSPEEPGSEEPSPEEPSPEEPSPEEPSPEEPSPEEPSPEGPSPEVPGPEGPGPVDAGGYESSGDDNFQEYMGEEVAVEVHANRESVRQNNESNNTSDASPTQERHRSLQILYCKGRNYPELSHSETGDYLEKYMFPFHKYFTAENSVLDKMSPEGYMHSDFHDIPKDFVTAMNEIQRSEMESFYRQQTGNISTGSASRKAFKLQNLNSEKSHFMDDLSRLKQYELLACKEETDSQENSMSSVSSSPLYSNKHNSKLDGSLKMKLKGIHQSSNRRYTERHAPQRSHQYVPCTEHSVTDHLEKSYFMRSQPHISKLQGWHNTKDVDAFSTLPTMNESSFDRQFGFTPTKGEDIDQEKYNYYHKASLGRCSFESKVSQDNYKRRYETADWVQNNGYGNNTCCCSAEDKLGYYMKDRRHSLAKEEANNDKDPIYFESYSHSDRFQHSDNIRGIGKFKSSSDDIDVESTLSDKLHRVRVEEAKLFVTLLKNNHYENLRKKSLCKLKRKNDFNPQFSSEESVTHYLPEKADDQNIGDNNGKSISETMRASELKWFGKSVSETMKTSELKYFPTSATNKKYISSRDEEFDVHDM